MRLFLWTVCEKGLSMVIHRCSREMGRSGCEASVVTQPGIANAEWNVMKVVWDKSDCSAAEIIDSLQAAGSTWHPKTIKTLIGRLVKKGALGFKRQVEVICTGRL